MATLLERPDVESDVEPDAEPAAPALRAPALTFTAVPAERPQASRWTLRVSTATCFGIALSTLLLTTVAPRAWEGLVISVAGILFLFTVLVAAVRFVRAIVVPRPGENRLAAVASNLMWGLLGAYVGALATFAFSRGRQLRRLGRVLLPRLRGGAQWTEAGLAPIDAADAPPGLAEQWRENGKTEHASVAAFARLTLDLMALGAPPRLVADCQRDALDEIRHAEICFGIARALDGRALGPSPFPEAQRVSTLPRLRTLALARLAVGSLVDGALHEGVSARVIAKLARRCAIPAIRDALLELAADEGRHAAHGWAVVEWCLAEGGAPVADALAGAVRALPAQAATDRPEPAESGAWERWGIHGSALEASEYAAAREHVAQRVHARIGRAAGAAA